jgi:NAD-dependent SIR2 family protein deacetylase
MALHHLTCPSCGAGFDSNDALRGHGYREHRDMTPKDRDILTCPECKAEFEARPAHDALEAEKLKKGIERTD